LEVEQLLAAHARASGFITPPEATLPLDSEDSADELEEPDLHVAGSSHYEIQDVIGRADGRSRIAMTSTRARGGAQAPRRWSPSRRSSPVRATPRGCHARAPHIAAIYAIDEAEGITFIAMELIQGERLRGVAPRKDETARALELATGVAKTRAHERGVVHRDSSPATSC
jgi:serine/threonine protein kinase